MRGSGKNRENRLTGCTRCNLCRAECAFLEKYGTPGEIAERKDRVALSFLCSLCGLCHVRCPEGLHPEEMFLAFRSEGGDLNPFKNILFYERVGTSSLFTFTFIPHGGDCVFFPGCTLPGTHPEVTFRLFDFLASQIPRLGLVLDCCLKISHDLGRKDYFYRQFQKKITVLLNQGINKVVTACPNCYRVFAAYGTEMEVKTVYEVLASLPFEARKNFPEGVTIHDPCPLRFSPEVHQAVRQIVTSAGITVREIPHHGENTLCCGEGGFVSALSPELARQWGKRIQEEVKGSTVITYCAGCTEELQGALSVFHVLEILFGPDKRSSHSLLNYFHRLSLKRKFQKRFHAPSKKGRLLFLLYLLLGFLLVRQSGLASALNLAVLPHWLLKAGKWAPFLYILIYSVAPLFLLPALPLTIVGGILFGPVFGVLYTLVGSTLGASLAFLVARYGGRAWVEEKLKGHRWQKFDDQVAKHGWKVVALVRLIPLFPFNLVNYAFGLTGIKFLPYVLATLIFMLPACIAFVVFSSSLPDLVKGRISGTFLLGVGLIGFLSFASFVYRKRKKNNWR